MSSLSVNNAIAHDGFCCILLRLRSCDQMFCGVGCYCKEATEKTVSVGTVLKGTGEIITAPFKSTLGSHRCVTIVGIVVIGMRLNRTAGCATSRPEETRG